MEKSDKFDFEAFQKQAIQGLYEYTGEIEPGVTVESEPPVDK